MSNRFDIPWDDPRYFENEGEGLIPFSEFVEAYYDCRKKKRRKESSVEFELNWEANLYALYREVMDGTYKIGRSIAFITTRPKKREVFAASFRDRIIHHLVCRKIEPLFEEYFIHDTYNCRVGKGTSYGLERLHQMVNEVSEGYTKDCWIAKFDMQGFFMSIHKPTLWRMLEAFMNERYNAPDKDIIMWLVEKIVMHSPEKDCIRKSPRYMWNGLHANKSLFTNGDDYGLPIGNLSSQMFANFYLTEFDKWMAAQFRYGRYVDDFFVIDRDKGKILDAMPEMRKQLEKVHVTLHPDKFYIQYYTKGVSFIGGVSKMQCLYVGDRTVNNFEQAIKTINGIEDKEAAAEHVMQSLNSYLGFMIHRRSYNIRKRMLAMLDDAWLEYFSIEHDYSKVTLKLKKTEKIEFTVLPD